MRTRKLEAVLRQRIGQRVFLLRRQRKMTALELAEKSGLHRNTIYRIEAGMSVCMVGQLWRIAQVLGVEMGEFVTDSPCVVHRPCETGKTT